MKIRSLFALTAILLGFSQCDPDKSENSVQLDFGSDTLYVSIGQEGMLEGTYTSDGPTPIAFTTNTLPANLIGKFTVSRSNSNVRILGPTSIPVNGTVTSEPHQFADILIEVNSNVQADEGIYELEVTGSAQSSELYEPAQSTKTIYVNVQNNDASCIAAMLGGYTVNDNCSANNPYSGTVVQSPTELEIWFNFPAWGNALVVGQVRCATQEIIVPEQSVTTGSGLMDIEGTATFTEDSGDHSITLNYTMVPSGSGNTPINCQVVWDQN